MTSCVSSATLNLTHCWIILKRCSRTTCCNFQRVGLRLLLFLHGEWICAHLCVVGEGCSSPAAPWQEEVEDGKWEGSPKSISFVRSRPHHVTCCCSRRLHGNRIRQRSAWSVAAARYAWRAALQPQRLPSHRLMLRVFALEMTTPTSNVYQLVSNLFLILCVILNFS